MSAMFAMRWRLKALKYALRALPLRDLAYLVNVFPKMVACGEHVLPEEAAPGVSFEEASRPLPIYEVFAPGSWSPADRERLAGYRMIGSDGAGNPICIEQGTGAVVLVDHEDWFHTRQFINSSVRQLADCLLAYMGENDAARFRSAVQAIDPAALAEESFWGTKRPALGDRPNWPPLPAD